LTKFNLDDHGPLLLNASEEYNIELYSCVACESQKFFKRVFYLKHINFMTGDPLASGSPGQLPPLPPLNQALGEQIE